MRAFFAVDVPDALADPLADLQSAFEGAEGLRFVDPTRAHVTLKFLGEVADGDRDDVIAAGERAVERADVDPFSASIAGLGVFPSLEYVSVVWAGVDEGAAALTRLHEALETETTALGYDPEDHAFTPHVTLARMDDARGKDLVRTVVTERDPTVGSVEVGAVRLVASTLSEDGPAYETVATVGLD